LNTTTDIVAALLIGEQSVAGTTDWMQCKVLERFLQLTVPHFHMLPIPRP
jgi:hypothetical protein